MNERVRKMRRKEQFVLFVLVIMSAFAAQAATAPKQATVNYILKTNGKERGEGPSVILRYIDGRAIIDRPEEKRDKKLIAGLAKEMTVLDFNAKKVINRAEVDANTIFHYETAFSEMEEVTFTNETEKILGYNCKLAKMNLRSNRIDVWYTEEAGIQGTPYQPTANVPGLVLKMVRNGNFEMLATSVDFDKKKNGTDPIPSNWGELVSSVEYQARLREALIQTVTVFEHEQLNFDNDCQSPKVLDNEKVMHFAKGTVVLRKVTLPELPDSYNIFAEVVQCSNGDAYDRTGSVFLIPTDSVKSFLNGMTDGVSELPYFVAGNGKKYQGMKATEGYLPPVELVRFFTPFGVRHFNDKVKVKGQVWADSAYFKQDVSELRDYLKKDVWIGAYIANYDKGGHYISMKLKYYPDSPVVEEKSDKYWQMPLFCSLNLLEIAGQDYPTLFGTDSLTVSFRVPEKVKNIQLRYISTGHGGWGGGDEFNQKNNEIWIDGKLAFSYTPWRTDCAVFRNSNPASGNFWNGLSSSDLSRSGWCPGSLTNPVFIPLPELEPGKHTLKVAIPQGEKEGSSESYWCVSGVILGEKE